MNFFFARIGEKVLYQIKQTCKCASIQLEKNITGINMQLLSHTNFWWNQFLLRICVLIKKSTSFSMLFYISFAYIFQPISGYFVFFFTKAHLLIFPRKVGRNSKISVQFKCLSVLITMSRLSYGLKTKRKMRKSDEKINFIIGKIGDSNRGFPFKSITL